MTLFKTTIWTGLSTLIKVILTFLMWKIIAIYTGPIGLALVEQFQNFIQICHSLACGLNQGIIKYISEFKHDDEKKSQILSSAVVVYFIVSIFLTILLLLFSNELSVRVFHSTAYSQMIKLLALSITFFSLNSLFLSVLNGEFEIKKYVACNIANTILIFTMTVYLVMNYGVQGGLIGFVSNQSIIFLLTSYLVVKSKWFKLNSYIQGIDKDSLVRLVKYALIPFAPILIVPISLLILRKLIVYQLSWQDAGYWQGIMRLSEGYLIMMELMINVYFIPKISGVKTLLEFKKEIFSIYRLVVPVVITGLIAVFFLKKQIILIIYDKEFLPTLVLFKYQLIGDMAKIGTWLLANVMAARAMVKILVISEIIFNISLILLTFIFVNYFGLVGTSIAFAINGMMSFSIMIFWTIRCFRNGSFRLVGSVGN